MSESKKNSKIEIVTIDPEYFKNREKMRESENEKNDEIVASSTSQELVPISSMSVTQQKQREDYSQSPPNYPYYNDDTSELPLHLFQQAGVRLSQAQSLNYLIMKNQLELHKKQEELKMDFYHALSMQNLKNSFQPAAEPTISMIPSQVPSDSLIAEFITVKSIVRVRSNLSKSGWAYFLRDMDIFRHFKSNENMLVDTFQEWLYEKIGDKIDEISSKEMEKILMKLKRSVPELQKSKLKQLTEEQLLFANGIYDFATGEFKPCSPNDNIFNRYSLPFNYDAKAPDPVAFESMLNDMMNHDEVLIILIFEIIGAILSNAKLLKKIFVFQGVSNGGKTRLMNVIGSLFMETDMFFVNSISNVTSDSFQKQIEPCHLVCVNDSADKKISSVQASYLKSFADGNINDNGNSTKIIVATNHAITSGNDRSLEPALLNRFLVVPFKKAMSCDDQNVKKFEKTFLNKERDGIIRKALDAFSTVVQNEGEFCCSPPINEYVVEEIISYTDSERKNITEIKNQGGNFSYSLKKKLYQIFDDIYMVTESCNAEMTLENIANQIKKLNSVFISNYNQLEKDLRTHFGEKLKSERVNDKNIYNLKIKKKDEE